jgi:N-acyl-phosphatidylethanolamine-hydrolysing phospholipase D
MRLVAGGVRLATLAAVIALSACPMQRESGGRKDMATHDASRPAHHVAGGFRNPVPIPRPGIDVTLPFFVRRAAGFMRSRRGAPPLVATDAAFLRENATHSTPTVTWIGHATVLVQMDHVTILTDPIWSATASPLAWLGPRRFVPPPLALDALPPIDFVLISHNHYDHLDLPTLRRLAARGTRFLVPLRVGALLRDAGIEAVEELDWWDTRRYGDIAIHCVPSQHWSGRGLTDGSATLWAGWAVIGPTHRFYFAGDTGYFDGFTEIGRRLGPFGLAAIPIGAYEPGKMMQPVHLNPEEALRAGLEVGAETMLGIHYGTFDLTDEPLDEPPRRFHAAADGAAVDPARLWTLAVGETRRW